MLIPIPKKPIFVAFWPLYDFHPQCGLCSPRIACAYEFDSAALTNLHRLAHPIDDLAYLSPVSLLLFLLLFVGCIRWRSSWTTRIRRLPSPSSSVCSSTLRVFLGTRYAPSLTPLAPSLGTPLHRPFIRPPSPSSLYSPFPCKAATLLTTTRVSSLLSPRFE